MVVTNAASSQGKYCPHFDSKPCRLDNGAGIAHAQISRYFDRCRTSRFDHGQLRSLRGELLLEGL